MAKDPAFLFYPGDWLGGTLGMTFEEKGAYLDLLIYQFNRGAFSEKQAISVLRNTVLWETLKSKFRFDGALYSNNKLQEEKERRQKYTESRRLARTKSDEDDVRIYIVRDNVRLTYKIGSSANPMRRYNELANQKSPAKMEPEQGSRDFTLLWYSDPVLRKEETELHKHFKTKRLTGEWFELNKDDLDFIFNKYKGSYIERTINRTNERTETETEAINRIIDQLESKNNISIKDIEKKYFMYLVVEMVRVFTEANPDYFFDKETDYSACLQISYHIATLKKWTRSEVVNGRMNDCLSSWTTIVDFIKKDEWLRTRSLYDLSTVKEWQRLIQKMNAPKNGKNKTSTIGKDIEFDKA